MLAEEQGGYRCDCGKWINSPEEQADHQDWHRRKAEGAQTAALLNALPVGTEITLGNAGRAYTGTYRRNAEGLWDQVWAVESPLVTNFDPAHLGFCVGYEPIREAVRKCPTL